MFGSALLCQRCANLSACNLKIELTDRISNRFIKGKALSMFFSWVVAKKYCSYSCVLFCLYFFYLSFIPTPPCKNSIRYVWIDKTIIKLF